MHPCVRCSFIFSHLIIFNRVHNLRVLHGLRRLQRLDRPDRENVVRHGQEHFRKVSGMSYLVSSSTRLHELLIVHYGTNLVYVVHCELYSL